MSESEWTLQVELRENGTLVVWYTTWLPEDPEDVVTARYDGKWSLDGDEVTIVYGGWQEKLLYHPKLSLEELGKDGTAPGFRGLSKDRAHDLFAARSLWLAEELDKIFPPE